MLREQFRENKEKTEDEDYFEVRKEKEAEKMDKLLFEITSRLRQEGIPVTSDCRIDMDGFDHVYAQSKIERDGKEAIRILGGNTQERRKKDGERHESLKTILFNKFIGEGAIVARSSIFDDSKRGVDNVIMDRESGGIICAFDEVASTKKEKLYEKLAKVTEKNAKGGANLEYGIYKEEEEIKLGRVNNVPIFCLSLSKTMLDHFIKELPPSLDNVSEDEKRLFYDYFSETIKDQAKALLSNRYITESQRDLIEKLFSK